jgi:hypothetical protein
MRGWDRLNLIRGTHCDTDWRQASITSHHYSRFDALSLVRNTKPTGIKFLRANLDNVGLGDATGCVDVVVPCSDGKTDGRGGRYLLPPPHRRQFLVQNIRVRGPRWATGRWRW